MTITNLFFSHFWKVLRNSEPQSCCTTQGYPYNFKILQKRIFTVDDFLSGRGLSQVYLLNTSRTLNMYEYLVSAYITLLLVMSTRSICSCHALLCFECFDVALYSRTEPSDDACLAKAHERSLVQIGKDRSLGSDACVLVLYLFV